MSAEPVNQSDTSPWTITCPRCDQAMRIAPEHSRITVECPHCETRLAPMPEAPAVPQDAATSPVVPPSPPQAGANIYPQRQMVSNRNKWVAGLLGVFLGYLGVHRFYLGFTGIGILQIVLSCITFGVAGVWGMVEGFLCFFGAMRDVDGLPLQD